MNNKYKYEYYFEKHGETRDKNDDGNAVWLDIGGGISKGVFDHHDQGDVEYKSTVDILSQKLDLLREFKDGVDLKQPVRVHLHEKPDLDTLFSLFYLQKYMELDEENFKTDFVDGSAAKMLIDYVNDIDTGKRKSAGLYTLYSMICHLDDKEVLDKLGGEKNNIDTSNKIIETALPWIARAVERMTCEEKFDIYRDALFTNDDSDGDDKGVLSIIKNKIDNELECYKKDKTEGRLVIKNIDIWMKSGGVKSVKAAIWNDFPADPASSYIIARTIDEADITFVPKKDDYKQAGETDLCKVIIAVNIDKPGNDALSLLELARKLEQLEQIFEKKKMARLGELRRDYSKPRSENKGSKFSEKPFSVTSDPWYISPADDIVDAPGVGSLIPVGVMIETLENITKMVKRTEGLFFYLPDDNANEAEVKSLPVEGNAISEWRDGVKKFISEQMGDKSRFYSVFVAEIDSAMISHQYEVLDAYFSGLSEGAYVKPDASNVFRLDYRTHLYVNQDYSVLFVATTDNTNDTPNMNGLIKWTEENGVKKIDAMSSSLTGIFNQIISEREKLRKIGSELGNMNRKEIQAARDSMMKLLADAQENKCLRTQIEYDVYYLIANVLDMEKLEVSVNNTLEIRSAFEEEKAYSTLNAFTMLAGPFLVLSALFQMGMIKFEPFIDNVGLNWSAIVPWIVFFGLTGIVTYWIYKKRK